MAWPPTTHQDVQDEVTALRNAGTGAGATVRHAQGTSVWYTSPGNAGGGAVNTTLNRLYLMPAWIRSGTLSDLACRVGTAGVSGAIARLGVYSSLTSGLPGSLLLDAGTVIGSTTGNKTVAVSLTIPTSGLYYLCLVSQTSIAGFTQVATSDAGFGGPILDLGVSSGHGLYADGVSGALPASPGTVVGTNASIPRLWYRMSA